MKKIIFAISLAALTLSAFAGIKDLALQRTQNYDYLSDYYKTLTTDLETSRNSEFCAHVTESYPNLVTILEDDQKLIHALKSHGGEDYLDYAVHLEENSASPLFSFYAHQDLCERNDPAAFKNSIQSLKYHVMNITYLSTNHNLWVSAYSSL